MKTDDLPSLISQIEGIISKVKAEGSIDSVLLKRNMNENWFSDTLAWLMDPQDKDVGGVGFIEEFLKVIAIKRHDSKKNVPRKNFLKYGKAGTGRPVIGKNRFALSNAAVIREFYLSGNVKRGSVGTLHCDLVLMNLDSQDGLMLTIENKLFSTNRSMQLENYYNAIEDKYKTSVNTREYVYLTLLGDEPVHYEGKSDKKVLEENWVCISWINDILPILQTIQEKRKKKNIDLQRVVKLLRWIKSVHDHSKSETTIINEFINNMKCLVAGCLAEELNRLVSKGKWEQKDHSEASIYHDSNKKRILYVQVMPNLSITVQGKFKSKSSYGKILIPLGIHPDQVFHFMHIAARGVYYKHFQKPGNYLNNNKKFSKKRTVTKKNIEPLLGFLYDNKSILTILVSFSSIAREAEKEDTLEMLETVPGENIADE